MGHDRSARPTKLVVASLYPRFAVGLLGVSLFLSPLQVHAVPPHVSDDRDLKELDLTGWNCLNRLEGSARTPDGVERNRLKNRSPVDLSSVSAEKLDTPAFLKHVAEFEAQTKGKRRKDLNPAERQQLDVLEKQVVQLTGYLGLAYVGPPETTNCASVDFHDWHLEVFEKPPLHFPQVGDPTPIICEITPRTQTAIFRDNVRIQQLAGYFRRSDFIYEATGHPAHKIQVTGYLLWDDEHNGSADVGTSVLKAPPNRFHNPWRSTAWEVHPIIRIVPADGSLAEPAAVTAPAQSAPNPPAENIPAPVATPSPAASTPAPTPTPPPQPQFATITQTVKIKIPYGETVLPRGTRVPVTSRTGPTITVEYMGGTYAVPVTSIDLQP
jgi:hypothetical protein